MVNDCTSAIGWRAARKFRTVIVIPTTIRTTPITSIIFTRRILSLVHTLSLQMPKEQVLEVHRRTRVCHLSSLATDQELRRRLLQRGAASCLCLHLPDPEIAYCLLRQCQLLRLFVGVLSSKFGFRNRDCCFLFQHLTLRLDGGYCGAQSIGPLAMPPRMEDEYSD